MDRYFGLNERPGNLYSRTPHPEDMPAKMSDGEGHGLFIQRRIVIKRDEHGYGLTVTGDNPVFVQSVREDGAAAKAGVKQGDRIIKVNGTLVSHFNHQAVVKLIKAEPMVYLTLYTRQSHLWPVRTASERITGPQPVDPQKQQEMNTARLRTIRKMYDQERIFVENLEAELLKSPSEKLQAEYNNAHRRLQEIQRQLYSISPNDHPLEPPHQFVAPSAPLQSEKTPVPPPTRRYTNIVPSPPKRAPIMRHLSHSLENLASKTWPCKLGHPHHSRQRSYPDNLYQSQQDITTKLLPRSKSEASSIASSTSTATTVLDDHRSSIRSHGSGFFHTATSSSRGSSFGPSDTTSASPPPSPPPPVPLRLESPHHKMVPSAPMLSSNEEEEILSPELNMDEDHGLFSAIWRLVRSPAHVAVFCHYLIVNKEAASLFFYLISFWYKQSSGKDLKRWAYEIYSTFIVPGAPLKVNNIDDAILTEIDNVLQQPAEKEELFKHIFQNARNKAELNLTMLLAEFRAKRSKGLGNLYGPPDYQLEEALADRNKELKTIENLLLPDLEALPEESEQVDDSNYALAISLATLLKNYNVRSPHAISLLEKYPTFIAKEKSRIRLRQKNKKGIIIQGHHFLAQQFVAVTYCNHCQFLIWGIAPQGYQCQECEMHIHKNCVRVVEEPCIGSLRPVKKDRRNNRMSGIVENFISKSRRSSERARRSQDEGFDSENTETTDSSRPEDDAPLLPPSPSNSSSTAPEASATSDLVSNGNKQKAMGRSESFRQRRENKPSFRKRSDPSIPRSKSDVDADSKPFFLSNNAAVNPQVQDSGSSSNSSLSARGSGESLQHVPDVLQTSTHHSLVGTDVSGERDSDLDAEPDPPNWEDNVDWTQITPLKPRDKKRQNIINELFHTERSHVRTLKILDILFRRPLSREPSLIPPDLLQFLFPNLGEMLALHSKFNNAMKARRREHGPIIGNIGDILLDMFDGEAGKKLQMAAAQFCRHQSMALDTLKNRMKKDAKLAQFLMDIEAHPLCRRLHLTDLLPTIFQRLVKYPLLLDSLAKYTPAGTVEEERVLKASKLSKQILAHVDKAVGEAADFLKLVELQRKLEKTAATLENDPQMQRHYQTLDLREHRLVHEGPLTWRTSKQKSLELHVVLLKDLLVLLQRLDGDRLALLKPPPSTISSPPSTANVWVPPLSHPPILPVQGMFTRNVATDARAFFLISSTEKQNAMYEFVASTVNERKTWQRHIAHISEEHKSTVSRNPLMSNFLTSPPSSLDHSDDAKTLLQEKTAENSSTLEPPSSNEGEEIRAAAIVTTAELIDPSQVQVMDAIPVETATLFSQTLAQLKQKEQEVQEALLEKQRLVARLLNIETHHHEDSGLLDYSYTGQRNLNQLILASMSQVDELARFVNEALSLEEADEGFSNTNRTSSDLQMASQLRSIAASLNTHFTQLLDLLSSQCKGGRRPDSFLSLLGESSSLSDDTCGGATQTLNNPGHDEAPTEEADDEELYVDASAASTTNLDDEEVMTKGSAYF